MLIAERRPRTLRWLHAGPLLYGDWGTSRLYVLGLAFFFTGSESVIYLLAISLLMAAVAWAYTIICPAFPDGGGVYSAARHLHPVVSVIGATLLLCGYIITAAISVVEAMHHIGIPDGGYLLALSVVTLAAIGVVNWLGARSAGRFALVVAIAALIVSAIMALLCLPWIPRGLREIHFDLGRGAWPHWTAFTHIVLALAGVEAVANMTGLMKRPVARTARRTIWPVLAEVVLLNLVFGVAMMAIFKGLPGLEGVPTPHASLTAEQLHAMGPEVPSRVEAIKNTAMPVIAERAAAAYLPAPVAAAFAQIAAIVFGLLLLSATNTAVMAMVSVLYSMAQDGELPRRLGRLNFSGVPWPALFISLIVCAVVVAIERRPEKLAELYIIGVCGAITVTVLSSAFNPALEGASTLKRRGLLVLGIFLSAVSLTIVVIAPRATLFAGSIVLIVLTTRFGLRAIRARGPAPIPEPAMGWLAELKRETPAVDPDKPRIMLAARGRYQAEFAVDLARRRGATLFVIFVRALRVMDVQPGGVPRVDDDPDAQESLGTVALLAREVGVPVVPIYVTSSDVVAEILDYTVTFGCDTLIMGKSRRSLFARKLEGDVVARVAENLPDEVALITRSADTPHLPRRAPATGETPPTDP